MNAEILAVGTELLMGQIANTNAQYISNRLPDVGVGVYYHSVVGDNVQRLKEVLSLSMKRSDVIITTGGLGPTQDDLTKETISEMLGLKLVLHKESLDKMEAFFSKLGRPMVKSNEKQAYIPEGSIIVKNSNGTAPGCIIEHQGKIIILLPGPPSEMKPMFEETVIPYFRSKLDHKLVSRYVRIFGIGESAMEEKIIDLINNQTNPTIAPYAKEGEVTLRVTARCSKEENGESLLNPVLDAIRKRLGNTVYSLDNESLDEVAGKLLLQTNTTLATAESCTGGLISGRLTALSGISKVFQRGFVTYSNEAKMENLGVKAETLQRVGAVSRETAMEMAEGVRRAAKSDLGLSVTGIAGPDGGTAEKPVGLVYVALASPKGVECQELKLWGDRTRIRNVTCLHAFNMIRMYFEQ